MGFGAGALISAVAYELGEEAFSTAGWWVAAGLFAGPRRARSSPRSGKADALDGKLAEHTRNALVLAVS